MHSFFVSSRPLVFAHRGGAALKPENTIEAFDNGIALGADGLELDVHLSRDGDVVVHHDRTLERTMRLTGVVAATPTAELSHAGVPQLAEVLSRYPDARIIIELKVNRVELARAVVDVVRRARAVERVCCGSFGTRVLRAVRTLEPSMATSAAREEVRWFLYRSWLRCPPATTPYDGFQIPEMAGSTRVVSPRFVAAAHRAGLGVQVWTVNAEDDARRLLAWGVDALITDRPDIMVSLVNTR